VLISFIRDIMSLVLLIKIKDFIVELNSDLQHSFNKKGQIDKNVINFVKEQILPNNTN